MPTNIQAPFCFTRPKAQLLRILGCVFLLVAEGCSSDSPEAQAVAGGGAANGTATAGSAGRTGGASGVGAGGSFAGGGMSAAAGRASEAGGAAGTGGSALG